MPAAIISRRGISSRADFLRVYRPSAIMWRQTYRASLPRSRAFLRVSPPYPRYTHRRSERRGARFRVHSRRKQRAFPRNKMNTAGAVKEPPGFLSVFLLKNGIKIQKNQKIF